MSTPANPVNVVNPAPVNITIPGLNFNIPGEAAVVALANLFQTLAEEQPADVRKTMYDRYIQITDPWQKIAVEVSTKAAEVVEKIINLQSK